MLDSMSIATPRPAATVVVFRDRAPLDDGDTGFEVLMVRRNDTVAFMAGAYVFPGGRVEKEDVEAAGGDEPRAFRLAAVRELDEETGVRVEPSDLVRFAHWVTPESEPRRYDTWFFLARLPDGQQARHVAGETTALVWLTPRDAIERCQRDEIMLPPPTWTTLKRMLRYRTSEELMAWARGVRVARIQPRLLREAERMLLTLPGDPAHPTVEGWEIPDETRFVLQDGRWRPVQP